MIRPVALPVSVYQTNRLVLIGILFFCVAAGPFYGQEPIRLAGKGTVTGNVTFGDTRLPARLVSVALYGVPKQATTLPDLDPSADQAVVMARMASALKMLDKVSLVQVRTRTDGSYTVSDVPVGDYYVFAAAAGYITPTNQILSALAGGADVKKPLSGVPMVHVTADRLVSADLVLERGAAISGTVVWSDGSPVSGATMSVAPAKADAPKLPQEFSMLAAVGVFSSLMVTDDLGHFRISSLAPGDYIVTATVNTLQVGFGAGISLNRMAGGAPTVIYAPNAWHKANAKPITLHAAENIDDARVTIQLDDIHSVSGRVLSLTDDHGINSAAVRLLDSADKSFVRSAPVDDAGNFTISYVPSGTYTLMVSGAEDTEPDNTSKSQAFAREKTVRSYREGKQPIVVADKDLTGQVIRLEIDKNPKPEVDFEKMLKEDSTPPSK